SIKVSPSWGARHEKEQVFQERSLGNKKLDAYGSGRLLPAEEATVDRNLLKQRRQHLIRLQKDQDRQAALQNQAPATLEELAQGKVIYSELDLGQEDLVVARRLRARVEDTCKDAKVCIVQNVAKLSLRASWVLALGGGAAVCPRFFRSNGQKGKSLCFQGPAKPWRVWLTPEFAEAKPHLAQLIRAHCAKK
ncbi:unnamed protein product, partial [Effrenium voratum]